MDGHVPALLPETVERLVTNPEGIYVDCTYGGGGHARALLERLGPGGRLVALDCDRDAAARAAEHAAGEPRLLFMRANFGDLEETLEALGIRAADGILFDLGLSFHQISADPRGFSFSRDGPLDMRMDDRSATTAADLVNHMPQRGLERMLAGLGEVRRARSLARQLVQRRRARPFESTLDLADAVSAVVPRGGKLHPATKVFQALRIRVNDELGKLQAGLEAAALRTAAGGRLAVISFHSLEDRIVKDFIRGYGRQSAPFRREERLVRPSPEEVRANPRSRSARLRVGIRRPHE